MLQGCLKEVEWVFGGSSQGVLILMVFQGRLWGCFKRPLRVIQRSFKFSKRSSKGVSRRFQRCFKEVSRVFQESFTMLSRIFKED